MSDIDWDNLANQAATQTDTQFNTTIASLTRMNITEIDTFIKESNISNANAIKVLQEINNAAAIANINNGVSFLVSLANKIV